MSPAGPTTITPLATYRNETPYPFCPGCGHGPILDRLNEALGRLQIDPRRVVLVSDIGCSGLSDQYFVTSAFHGLHGRSITYASGIQLARPDLAVIVVMGDGGTGIGGTHLINAARRNIGITVLVFNNFNFGMTGGQHSTTTPAGAVTSTTPGGNLERPLDICGTVATNGAGYVYRGTSFDQDLADRMAEAIQHPGFALLDIWELCTAYYVPKNKLSKKSLTEMLEKLQFSTGLLQKNDLPEYARAYREATAAQRGAPLLPRQTLAPTFSSDLAAPFRLVVAGSAGGRVGSAVRLAARGAVLSGLWAAQRGDYPVTVKSGHSIAELILSPREIRYPGVTRPDALALLTEDGLRKAGRYLSLMTAEDRVFALPAFAEVETRAPVTALDPARTSPSRRISPALVMVAAMVDQLGLFPPQALSEAARMEPESQQEASLQAVEAGLELG